MKKLALVVRTLDDVRLEDIVVYDVRTASPFFDYVVISSGQNARQLKAAIARLRDAFDEADYPRFTVEGGEQARWVLLDGQDIVINLFTPEERDYYEIEKIWHDVPQVDVEAFK